MDLMCLEEPTALQTSELSTSDQLVGFCESFSTPRKVRNEEEHENFPKVGMTFASVAEFEDFYNAYSSSNGFYTRRRSSIGDGYRRWVCRAAGFKDVRKKEVDVSGKKKRKTSSMRVGCQHAISLKFDPKLQLWIILSFESQHNHLAVTPNKAHFVPTGQTIEESGQHVIELFKDHGIPIGKVATLFGKGRFSKRNCYNHMRDVRSKILEVGDAQGVLEYCESQAELDPRFFYRMQIDDEGRMSNFFWVDARSRMAYKIFGDAIVFDTTYRTNRYEMPLAPFTGVDNHKRNILFGCALVMDEQQYTFEWLFRTWLEAMEGKEPISIITDQDKAISNAIHVVFPNVRHRFCIWHILKKFPEKLPPSCNKSKEFNREMQAIIQDSLSESHFIEQWYEIIQRYDLVENSWLKGLFEMKKEWVPVFTVDTFFAGMQASQRAESMNSLFNAKVNAGTSLQEFIRQYEIVMEDRYEAMRREDFESRHKKRNCDRNSYLEDHAAEVYTRTMYLEFYSELSKAERYRCVKLTDFVGPDEEYIVRHVTDPKEFYTVNISVISVEHGLVHNVGCSCGLFEWNGLLCRHIIKLFNCFTVVRIPDKYILKRWCKDVSRPLDVFANVKAEEKGDVVRRVLHLNHYAQQMASLASKDDSTYQFATSLYKENLTRIQRFIAASEQDQPSGDVAVVSGVGSSPTLLESQSTQRSVQVILNPNISKTKGRKKENKRWKSSLEVATSGQRRCGICRGTGHNATTCKRRNVEPTVQAFVGEQDEAPTMLRI